VDRRELRQHLKQYSFAYWGADHLFLCTGLDWGGLVRPSEVRK